jgi:hypothetical protein
MAIFAALCALGLLAPIASFFVLNRRGAPSPPSRRHTSWSMALAGSIGVTPLAFLITLGAYGDWAVMLLFWLFGAGYGALIGAALAWLRGFRHRDRTG